VVTAAATTLDAELLVDVTRQAVERGESQASATLAAACARLAARSPGVARLTGLADQAQGLAAGDAELLGRAAATLGAVPRPLVRAGAETDLGAALLRSGRRPEAIAALDTALRTFGTHGADGPAATTRRLLRAAGIRRSPGPRRDGSPVRGWAALSPSEQRVAALVAEGLSNGAAAEAVGVSTHTVATHLRSVYRKLGVASRTQLTRVVLARGPDDLQAVVGHERAGGGRAPHQN
jgi:DNA-binding CsgD family transcriptional regulator